VAHHLASLAPAELLPVSVAVGAGVIADTGHTTCRLLLRVSAASSWLERGVTDVLLHNEPIRSDPATLPEAQHAVHTFDRSNVGIK